jgi:hypothetical protein
LHAGAGFAVATFDGASLAEGAPINTLVVTRTAHEIVVVVRLGVGPLERNNWMGFGKELAVARLALQCKPRTTPDDDACSSGAATTGMSVDPAGGSE